MKSLACASVILGMVCKYAHTLQSPPAIHQTTIRSINQARSTIDSLNRKPIATRDTVKTPILRATVAQSGATSIIVQVSNAADQGVLLNPSTSFLNASAPNVLELLDSQQEPLRLSPNFPTSVAFAPLLTVDNFIRIPAKEQLNYTFDLAAIFDITAAADYSLNLTPTLLGTLEPVAGQDFNATASSQGFVNLTSENVLLKLSPPPPNKARALRFRPRDELAPIQKCSSTDLPSVQKSLLNLHGFAARARIKSGKIMQLRKRFFGTWAGDPLLQQRLDAAADYNHQAPGNPSGVRWFCNRFDAQVLPDTENVCGFFVYAVTYARRDIVLCNNWFQLNDFSVFVPGRGLGPLTESPTSRTAVAYHELMHTNVPPGPPIVDVSDKDLYSRIWNLGIPGGCYTYSCTTGLADHPWDGYTPLDNAANYEFYAMTVRAACLESKDCF